VTPNLRDDRMVFAREDGEWRIASNGFDVEVRVTCEGDGGSTTRTFHLVPAGATAWVGGATATPDPVTGLDVGNAPVPGFARAEFSLSAPTTP
jgi:hypothetical protein